MVVVALNKPDKPLFLFISTYVLKYVTLVGTKESITNSIINTYETESTLFLVIFHLLLALLCISFGFFFADMSCSQLLHLSY